MTSYTAPNNSGGKINYVFGFIFSILIMYFWLFGSESPKSHLVSGYKNAKFGMSHDQLTALKLCSLGGEQKYQGAPRLRFYSCDDFEFDGKRTHANFYFVEDELLRISILAGDSLAEGHSLIKPLREKYGPPSSYSENEANAFDQGASDKLEAAWADDSVILSLVRQQNSVMATLTYSSDVFQARALGKTSRSTASDL